MSKPKFDLFKPEDFGPYAHDMIQGHDPLTPATRLARVANDKLAKLIESWPIFYGREDDGVRPCTLR